MPKKTGCVSTLLYHIVWCTKDRQAVLTGSDAQLLRAVLENKARELNLTVEILNVDPDCVDITIGAPAHLAPKEIAEQLRIHTSRCLRIRWSRMYYLSTVGRADRETTKWCLNLAKWN